MFMLLDFIMSAKLLLSINAPIIIDDDIHGKMLQQLQDLPKESPIVVHLASLGGNVDVAERFAKEFKRHNTTCYTEFAASAAFQIILPSCQKRYVREGSVLSFHDAQIYLSDTFNERVGFFLLPLTKEVNDAMTENLGKMIAPDKGCGLLVGKYDTKSVEKTALYQSLAKRKNRCLLVSLIENRVMTAKDFIKMTPNSKAFILLKDSQWPFNLEKK